MLLLTSLNLWAQGPIKRHLVDASKINQQRKPLYELLTEGKSNRLSNELILMEKLALLVTGHLDQSAKEYLNHGVMLFEHDLVDMKYTPTFKASYENNQIPSERINLDIKNLRKHWLKLIRKDDLDSLYRETVELLDQKELSATNQNCLTRHFVESIARFIKNIEEHQMKAKINNLDDPKPLLVSFIKIQLHSLGWAYSLDKRAFQIQNKYGVPLFCQDVPVIDYH
jgi:hypothetical protein